MADFLAGLVGGVSQCLSGHPFDTMKVAMQTGRPGCETTASTMRTIWGRDGLAGFYRGVASPLAGLALLNATLFASYRTGLKAINGADITDASAPLASVFGAGAFAGVCASFVEGPVDLFKSKMQTMKVTEAGPQYKGTFDCAKQIVSKHGIRGVYQGLPATFIRNSVGYSLYFGFYQWTLRALHKDKDSKPSALAVMAAGSVGGMAFWALYPLDIFKTKLQTDASLVSERFYKGYMHCARHTYQTVGISGMMAGVTPCLIRAAVANAFCLLAYEQVLHMLHKDNTKKTVVVIS